MVRDREGFARVHAGLGAHLPQLRFRGPTRIVTMRDYICEAMISRTPGSSESPIAHVAHPSLWSPGNCKLHQCLVIREQH